MWRTYRDFDRDKRRWQNHRRYQLFSETIVSGFGEGFVPNKELTLITAICTNRNPPSRRTVRHRSPTLLSRWTRRDRERRKPAAAIWSLFSWVKYFSGNKIGRAS